MIRTTARAEIRSDGLLDVTYYGPDGIPIAIAEGYQTGEEAEVAFREYLKQLEAEREHLEDSEGIAEDTLPG